MATLSVSNNFGEEASRVPARHDVGAREAPRRVIQTDGHCVVPVSFWPSVPRVAAKQLPCLSLGVKLS
jgi:hypothetical protein